MIIRHLTCPYESIIIISTNDFAKLGYAHPKDIVDLVILTIEHIREEYFNLRCNYITS